MWDGILLFPDYRGVMFGMGDGHEQQLNGGDALELAYYVFRDPAYATVLRRSEKRSLLYGVPDLPEDTLRLFARSGYADNAGLAVLRSQKAGRPAREQMFFPFSTDGTSLSTALSTGLSPDEKLVCFAKSGQNA